MHRKTNRVISLLVFACLTASFTAGCGIGNKTEEVDFSGIGGICELATLKCYYHNVARVETEASGILAFLGRGYKKIWTEYSGVVELGIDVDQVTISQPDADGVVTVAIPDAKILNVDLDEDSIEDPVTDTGILTSITTEEEAAALAGAQEDMEETAASNEDLLNQAKERAKDLIEGYVKNTGALLGEEYTVKWVDADISSDSSDNDTDEKIDGSDESTGDKADEESDASTDNGPDGASGESSNDESGGTSEAITDDAPAA